MNRDHLMTHEYHIIQLFCKGSTFLTILTKQWFDQILGMMNVVSTIMYIRTNSSGCVPSCEKAIESTGEELGSVSEQDL